MKVNVFLMSKRYLKEEYFSAFMSAMNIHKIYSFIKLNTILFHLFNEVTYIPRVQNELEETQEGYWEFVNAIIDDITSLSELPEPMEKRPDGVFGLPTIVIIADWHPLKEQGYMPYDLYLKSKKSHFRHWPIRAQSHFPFSNNYGDLDEHIAKGIKERLSQNNKAELLESIRLVKAGVAYIVEQPFFTRTFDFMSNSWRIKVFKDQKTQRECSFIRALHFHSIKKFPDIDWYEGEGNRKRLKSIRVEEAFYVPDECNS
jgi:hypothetical protein